MIALRLPGKEIKEECAKLLEALKQWPEAAELFEKAECWDSAAIAYIKMKNWYAFARSSGCRRPFSLG
jgi:WD repeat-containing protein 19